MAVTGVFSILLCSTLFFASFAVVSNGQNQMTNGENSSRTGAQHEDKQAKCVSTEQHVVAVEGDSVSLTCLVDNQSSVEDSTLDWSKDGMKQYVHVYRHRKDYNDGDQDERFKGKTILDHEGLKRGYVNLTLQSVRLSDSGRYSCYIKLLDCYCYINLTIVPKAQNNMTQGENSSTTGRPDEDNRGESGLNRNLGRAIILPIIFLVFFIFIVILARRHEAVKSKMKRTNEENPLMPTNHQGALLLPSTSTPEISINQGPVAQN